MNLPISWRIALPTTLLLVLLLGVYAFVVLDLERDRQLSDIDQKLEIETYVTADLIRLSPGNLPNALQLRDIVEAEEVDSPEGLFGVDVWSGASLLYRKAPIRSRDILSAIKFSPATRNVSSLRVEGRRVHMVQLAFRHQGAVWYVRAAADVHDAGQLNAIAVWIVAGGGLLFLVFAVASSYWVARLALRPLTAIAEQTAAISASNLAFRLPLPTASDEISKLTVGLNLLLGRMQSAFSELRGFAADVSHELRTPLTVVRSIAESTLNAGGTTLQCQDALGNILEEVDRLTELLGSLLTLARAEVDTPNTMVAQLSPRELVETTSAQLEPLAANRQQTLSVYGAATPPIAADARLVDLALTNVIHNAIKFTPVGGRIDVHVACDAKVLTIAIDDTGPGIAPAEREKVFERFYRSAHLESRNERGFGLGLSIARSAIARLGGSIEASSAASGGARMIIKIPLRDSALL